MLTGCDTISPGEVVVSCDGIIHDLQTVPPPRAGGKAMQEMQSRDVKLEHFPGSIHPDPYKLCCHKLLNCPPPPPPKKKYTPGSATAY